MGRQDNAAPLHALNETPACCLFLICELKLLQESLRFFVTGIRFEETA
jgi:hypothetical protein